MIRAAPSPSPRSSKSSELERPIDVNPVPPLRTADDLGLMHDGDVREAFRNGRRTVVFGPFFSSTYGDFDELTTGMRG